MEEEVSKLRLPIIIGAFESQAIAVYMERMTMPRPLTNGLFKNTLEALGAVITEMLIHYNVDGIFHAWMVVKAKEGTTINIDARPSDAIALGVRYDCPIYVYEFVLDEAGIEESEKN